MFSGGSQFEHAGGDGGGVHANPRMGPKTRLLSIASHNASESRHEQASRSRFSISLQNDLQNVGSVTGVSIDTIGFPNTFPNIREPSNTFLFRHTAPAFDTTRWDGGIGRLEYQGVVYDCTFAGRPGLGIPDPNVLPFWENTEQFATYIKAIINADTPPALEVEVLVDPTYGVIELVFNEPVKLLATNAEVVAQSDYWEAVVGIPRSQLLFERTVFVGTPINSGGIEEISIPEGYWNSDQLAAYIGEQMTDKIPAGLEAILEPIAPWDQRFQLRLVDGDDLGRGLLLFPPEYLGGRSSGIRNLHIPSLLHLMGFLLPPDSYNELTQADDLPRLNGEQLVYLHSDSLMGDSLSFDGEGAPDQTVCAIPVTAPFLEMNVYSPTPREQPLVLFNEPRQLREVDIELRDIYGRPLELGGAQQMYVQARLWFS